MFISFSHSFRSPQFLVWEVVAFAFLTSLLLVTTLNYMEVRRHPERFRKASLAIFVGIAIATGLTALHNHIPFWQFGVCIYVGMVAGLIAFLVAPSKQALDRALRKFESGNAPGNFDDSEIIEPALPLSEAPKLGPPGGRRPVMRTKATEVVTPRKINTRFNQQRIISQILELSEEAEKEGVPTSEIIEILQGRQYKKSLERQVG